MKKDLKVGHIVKVTEQNITHSGLIGTIIRIDTTFPPVNYEIKFSSKELKQKGFGSNLAKNWFAKSSVRRVDVNVKEKFLEEIIESYV